MKQRAVRKKKSHYLDNEKFTAAINRYIDAREKNPELTLNEFEEGDYIGLGIMQICINQTKKSNFATYTWRDEMISDAIENCIKCVKNFTKEKSANAFGYFSKVAEYAFIRRIQKEKKMQEKKFRYLSCTKNLSEVLSNQFAPMDTGHENDIQQFVEQIQTALLENDQLMIIQSGNKPKRKVNHNTTISKLLKKEEK